MKRLLDDLRVVELAGDVPGSFCGKLFADLGADVIKVEPPSGARARHDHRAPEAAGGGHRSGQLMHLDANKRSVVLSGSALSLLDLLSWADLVIESSDVGNLGEHGQQWEQLHADIPGLSVVHISGFGLTGPYAGFAWSDIVVQAMSGAIYAQADNVPIKLPGRIGSCMVGHFAALGALAAVTAVRNGGAGSLVDCSAFEALSTQPLKASFILGYQYRDRTPLPPMEEEPTTLIPTGIFPCGDGHVAMMSTPQQLGEMLDVLDDDNLRAAFARPDAFERADTKEAVDAALYPWLLSHTRAEITAAAQQAGWPLAGVNLPAEVLDADHLHQRGFWTHTDDPVAGSIDLPGPPARFSEGGYAVRRLAPGLGEQTEEVAAEISAEASRDRSPRPAPRPPLEGVRVLDMTTVWAGPFATMLLADLGAEVIRVENPFVLPPTTKGYSPRPVIADLGLLGSMYGPIAPGREDRPWNRHAMNNSLCRNKRSVAIDTGREQGRELVLQLAEKCDVFIENFKLSGLDHIGIKVSELQARNPSMVIVRMPPAGTSGEWSGYSGFGAQFDGLSGLAWTMGHPGSDPVTSPSTTYMDAASGPAAAYATVAALRYRDATGRGVLVEVPQVENVIGHLGDMFLDIQLGIEPERRGNRDPLAAPQGIYPCGSGTQLIAVTVASDDQWRALAELIGSPELVGDQRLADVAGRFEHHDEIDELIRSWVSDLDQYDAFAQLQALGIPAGPVLDEVGFDTEPQMVARGWMQPLESLDVGTHLHAGPPYTGVPQVWDRGSPVLGQDNEYVYKEILGVSDAEYERYGAERMHAIDYLDPDGNPY